MTSHMTRHFLEQLAALPAQVQRQAQDAYAIFQKNSSHPGLRFKQVNSGPPPVYSARVGIGYRALDYEGRARSSTRGPRRSTSSSQPLWR